MANPPLVWHFGFDITAVQEGNTSYLLNGLVEMENPATPASPNVLTTQDTISFYAFDVTATGVSGYSPISAIFTFSNAQTGQSVPCPFNTSITIPLSGNTTTDFQVANNAAVVQIGPLPLAAAAGKGTSAMFGPTTTYRQWGILPGLQISNRGRFLFNVELTVQQGEGGPKRTFFVDPEMIVGGTN
ncbi:MAG TPA: hypothetical protein VN493_09500 [Thermoanaerobaculia bacterium]|nr:hypothetical protein [Thermoanaerobaculia bacterium]